MNTYEIIPGIGASEKTWEEIEKKIELVKPFAKTIHIDIVDGKFADNETLLDPEPFKKYTKDIKFELHMMVQDPIHYLKPWADAGFQRFIGHVEHMKNQAEFVAEAQLLGEVGLAIDKQTPIDAIKVPFRDLDALLVMTIQAGFSGQEFIEDMLEKFNTIDPTFEVACEVDGGITDETIEIAAAKGATRFVTTSFLFSMDNPVDQYNILKKRLDELQRPY